MNGPDPSEADSQLKYLENIDSVAVEVRQMLIV